MSINKSMFVIKYGEVKDQSKHVTSILDDPESSMYEIRHVAHWLKSTRHNPERLGDDVIDTIHAHPRAMLAYHIRDAISIHPKTPKHVIDSMLTRPDHSDAWHGIANRPDVTPEQLTKIAVSGIDSDAMRSALQNPSAPKELLDKFSHHSDQYVAASVAYNPNSTEEHLKTIEKNHLFTVGKDAVDAVRRRRGITK